MSSPLSLEMNAVWGFCRQWLPDPHCNQVVLELLAAPKASDVGAPGLCASLMLRSRRPGDRLVATTKKGIQDLADHALRYQVSTRYAALPKNVRGFGQMKLTMNGD